MEIAIEVVVSSKLDNYETLVSKREELKNLQKSGKANRVQTVLITTQLSEIRKQIANYVKSKNKNRV
jgi:hypothetical protein